MQKEMETKFQTYYAVTDSTFNPPLEKVEPNPLFKKWSKTLLFITFLKLLHEIFSNILEIIFENMFGSATA